MEVTDHGDQLAREYPRASNQFHVVPAAESILRTSDPRASKTWATLEFTVPVALIASSETNRPRGSMLLRAPSR